jgi:hypothetical protein
MTTHPNHTTSSNLPQLEHYQKIIPDQHVAKVYTGGLSWPLWGPPGRWRSLRNAARASAIKTHHSGSSRRSHMSAAPPQSAAAHVHHPSRAGIRGGAMASLDLFGWEQRGFGRMTICPEWYCPSANPPICCPSTHQAYLKGGKRGTSLAVPDPDFFFFFWTRGLDKRSIWSICSSNGCLLLDHQKKKNTF